MNPRLAAATTGILWGLTYIITTNYLPHNPVLLGAVRGIGAGLVLLAISFAFPPKEWIFKLVILGTLNVGFFFGTFFISVVRLPGGVAAIFQAMGPLCALLLAWLVLKAKPTLTQYICIIIGIIGVSLVVLKSSAKLDMIGVIAAILCVTSISLGAVLMNKWGKIPMSFFSITGWQLLVGGLELVVVAFILGDFPQNITSTNIIAFVILIVFLTSVPFFLWFRAIAQIGAVNVVPFVILSPVVAFITDAVFSHHIPTYQQIIGVLLVFISIFANNFLGKKQRV
ncbi:MAG: DMT family transporter [Campylobacteraceae bacterium]